ncbi:MAG: AGE family epimerase/isomerase [Phycisphaerae bacterium]|nr:AGE family epimerase/isomerase [Phycisphaerae bacterium]
MGEWTDAQFAASVRQELLEDILPFWRSRTLDSRHGGFIGQMSNDLRVQEDAPKGLILNARILWSFSAFYRYTKEEKDRALAQRAYEYLTDHFLDQQHGGYFWELDPRGAVLDDKKKIYGQAFCIYAMAEYYRTFNEPRALRQAVDVFDLMEAHTDDEEYGGYFEVMSRDWRPCEDMRLSDKDMNEKKSMNNHLHVLEGYTNLLRVWSPSSRGRPAGGFEKEERRRAVLAASLQDLIDVFRRHIVNREHTHFQHFFDEIWTPRSDSYTFGHDIEGSWLLCEAAEVLLSRGLSNGWDALVSPAEKQEKDARVTRLTTEVRSLAAKMARAALKEGLDADGGLLYEGRNGRIINPNKEWWPQAEAVVGFWNAWQLSGDAAFRDAAMRCWQFIQDKVVDHQHGEWFWCIRPDGTPDPAQPKVSAWKGPYHNGRCCLEIIRRIHNL